MSNNKQEDKILFESYDRDKWTRINELLVKIK